MPVCSLCGKLFHSSCLHSSAPCTRPLSCRMSPSRLPQSFQSTFIYLASDPTTLCVGASVISQLQSVIGLCWIHTGQFDYTHTLSLIYNNKLLHRKRQLVGVRRTHHRGASCCSPELSGLSGWDERWHHQEPTDPGQYRTSSTDPVLAETEKNVFEGEKTDKNPQIMMCSGTKVKVRFYAEATCISTKKRSKLCAAQ